MPTSAARTAFPQGIDGSGATPAGGGMGVHMSTLPDAGQGRGGRSRQRPRAPDVRLVRRARTIANLARVISERKVKVGIRRTLWAQARRLERLERKQLEDFNGG